MNTDDQKVVIIGAGKVGTAMALALFRAGFDVVEVVDPDRSARERAAGLVSAVPGKDPAEACNGADLVVITTPDGLIARVCDEISRSGIKLRGRKVMHMSGALPLDVLEPVREKGADVLCVHPLQTFADLDGAMRALPGSRFGVTCEPGLESWASDLVAELGGSALIVEDSSKVIYHTAAVMACNLITMVVYGAEVLYRKLGFTLEEAKSAFMPLLKATVDNIDRLGPAGALTGPLARGDLQTIGMHLEELKDLDPELLSLYREVSIWGLKLVEEQGETGGEVIDRMRFLLEEY